MSGEDRDLSATLASYMEKNCFASLEQIGKQFRLGPYTVQKHLRNAGVPSFKKFRKFLICCALLEYIRNDSGITAPKLAKCFNVSQQLINHYLMTLKIKLSRRRDRASMIGKQDLATYVESNPDAVYEKIGGHFGVSRSYIWKLIKEFNIPYQPKRRKVTMTDKSLAAFIAEHPELTQQEIAAYFEVSKYTIQTRIKKNKILYRSKKSKVDPISFIQYISEHPEATRSELASYFRISLAQVGRLRRLFPENNFDIALARYIDQHPNVNENELKRHFRVNKGVIRQHLASGIPGQWTKEVVEKLLDKWVLRLGDELAPGLLAKEARHLNRAFHKFELYRKYPLHYWRFEPLIYPLFGMDMPKNYEEELQMEWPAQKILHKRYRELLRIHHPDRHHHNPQTAKAAHFKFRWIVKAYSHLLKRRKKLIIGEPPPAIKQTGIIANNGKRIAAS